MQPLAEFTLADGDVLVEIEVKCVMVHVRTAPLPYIRRHKCYWRGDVLLNRGSYGLARL